MRSHGDTSEHFVRPVNNDSSSLPDLHYLDKHKSVVCRCNETQHRGYKQVRNAEIKAWSASFFRLNRDEFTCTRQQWRAHSGTPTTHPTWETGGETRHTFRNSYSFHQAFDVAIAHFHEACATGISPNEALFETNDYIVQLVGYSLNSNAREKLLRSISRSGAARSPGAAGFSEGIEDGTITERSLSSFDCQLPPAYHSYLESDLIGSTTDAEHRTNRPSNLRRHTYRGAACDMGRVRHGRQFSTANISRARRDSGPAQSGHQHRSGSDRRSHSVAHVRQNDLQRAQLHDQGWHPSAKNYATHRHDPEWPPERAHDRLTNTTSRHIVGSDDDTSACLQLVLNIIPNASIELVVAMIQSTALHMNTIQARSEYIINELLEADWTMNGSNKASIDVKQTRRKDLAQHFALQELISPFQDPWRDSDIEFTSNESPTFRPPRRRYYTALSDAQETISTDNSFLRHAYDQVSADETSSPSEDDPKASLSHTLFRLRLWAGDEATSSTSPAHSASPAYPTRTPSTMIGSYPESDSGSSAQKQVDLKRGSCTQHRPQEMRVQSSAGPHNPLQPYVTSASPSLSPSWNTPRGDLPHFTSPRRDFGVRTRSPSQSASEQPSRRRRHNPVDIEGLYNYVDPTDVRRGSRINVTRDASRYRDV